MIKAKIVPTQIMIMHFLNLDNFENNIFNYLLGSGSVEL